MKPMLVPQNVVCLKSIRVTIAVAITHAEH